MAFYHRSKPIVTLTPNSSSYEIVVEILFDQLTKQDENKSFLYMFCLSPTIVVKYKFFCNFCVVFVLFKSTVIFLKFGLIEGLGLGAFPLLLPFDVPGSESD